MKKSHIAFSILFFWVTTTVVTAQNWHYNFNEAQEIAQETNKNIVLLFVGSDWCPPCIRLERKILSDPDFKKFADTNFVWVKADFPKRKKNRLSEEQQKLNDQLADRYNKKRQFPVLLVIDPNGIVLGATGYRKMSPERYIKLLTTFDSFGN